MRTHHFISIVVWMVGVLFLTGRCIGGEVEFSFRSDLDRTEQKAVAYVPKLCVGRDKNPLLVVAHYMGGDRYTARREGYYPECDGRGWLLVCPELHGRRTGGATSLAALEAQHDVIGAIEHMKKTYRVDGSRIYLDGRSMGGMLAQLMAAKYPDVFAAVVAGQGISDLELWRRTTLPDLKANIEMECGPFSEATRFDYQRRSAIFYAANFQYVPLIMWHGTNDTWVRPEQSVKLLEAIRKYKCHQPEVNWLQCSPHCAVNYPPKWICDQVHYYQNVGEAGTETAGRFFPELDLVTDESKGFFWLRVELARPNTFGRVSAKLAVDVLSVRTENLRGLVVDLDRISRLVNLTEYEIKPDGPVDFSIVRQGKPVFSIHVEKESRGRFPKDLLKSQDGR